MNATIRLLLPACAAAVLAAGCVQSVEDALPKAKGAAAPVIGAKPPVATVDGRPIAHESFELFVSAQTQGRKPEDLPPEVRQQFLEEIIRVYVARAQAEKEGLDRKPEIAARLDVATASLLANQVNDEYAAKAKPSDADVKAEYDAVVATLPKVEYRARHVLVKTEQEARDIIAALGRGASIADIAKKASQDGGSRENGGDLGWFRADRMVKPFADALATLQKGGITQQPVKSEFGWHVIKLEDTRPIAVPPLDQVRDQVARMVEQKKLTAYLDGLAKGMKIERKL
jgi:peptidyl-prolyl cis-trans isomerase C